MRKGVHRRRPLLCPGQFTQRRRPRRLVLPRGHHEIHFAELDAHNYDDAGTRRRRPHSRTASGENLRPPDGLVNQAKGDFALRADADVFKGIPGFKPGDLKTMGLELKQ